MSENRRSIRVIYKIPETTVDEGKARGLDWSAISGAQFAALPLVKSVWLFTHAVVPAIALSLLIQPNFFNKGSTNLVLWVFSALLENEKTLGTRLREARRRCARGFIGIRKIRSRRFPFPLCFSSSPWPRCGSSLQRSIDDRVQMKRRLGRVKYASDQL